jgi:hypothetical protein
MIDFDSGPLVRDKNSVSRVFRRILALTLIVWLTVTAAMYNVLKTAMSSRNCTAQEEPNCKTDHPLLCVFTTFKPALHKEPVYVNTLRNWALLGNHCTIRKILFITSADTSKSNFRLAGHAINLGWDVMKVNSAEHGVPFFKDMYFKAEQREPNCTFYGYSNGDMIYSTGIISTLTAIWKVFMNTSLQQKFGCFRH